MPTENDESTGNRRNLIFLAGLSSFFVCVTAVWLWLDRRPPSWDDAWYLANSLVLYDTLVEKGAIGFATKFLSILGFKAPLITVLPTPLYLVFGRRWHAAYLVNLAAMPVLFAAVYAIGKRLHNSRAGLVAAYVTGTMPLLYGLSRWFLVEYALTAIVAVGIWTLLVSDRFESTRYTVLFGVICGLGLLLKVSFPLFVMAPFVYLLARSPKRARAVLVAGLPCAVLALPWYSLNYRATLGNALSAGFGYSAMVQGTGSILSIHAISEYLSRIVNDVLSVYYVLLALGVGGLALLRRRRGGQRGSACEWAYLSALWAVPFLIFLFGGNKDVRYVAPLAPAVALWIAASIEAVFDHSRRSHTVVGLLLVFPLAAMIGSSFGLPLGPKPTAYGRSYSRVQWPLEEILDTVAGHAKPALGTAGLLLVGTDREAFNANTIELFVVRKKLPFTVASTAYDRDADSVRRRMDAAAFFVYKEGGEPESPYFNRFQKEAIARAHDPARFEEIPYGNALPDGGVVHIFRARPQSPENQKHAFVAATLGQTSGLSLSFGTFVELTGFSFERAPGLLTVRYRWRSLGPVPRDYWCFTHVLDSQGRVIAFLDHRLLEGQPPLTSWQRGDQGFEEKSVPIPASVAPEKLRLRLGLYDTVSGERLPVTSPAAAFAGRFSLSDHGTSLVTLEAK